LILARGIRARWRAGGTARVSAWATQELGNRDVPWCVGRSTAHSIDKDALRYYCLRRCRDAGLCGIVNPWVHPRGDQSTTSFGDRWRPTLCPPWVGLRSRRIASPGGRLSPVLVLAAMPSMLPRKCSNGYTTRFSTPPGRRVPSTAATPFGWKMRASQLGPALLPAGDSVLSANSRLSLPLTTTPERRTEVGWRPRNAATR
jgi:hypothetical protein